MRRIVALSFLITFFFACSNLVEEPKNLLSKSTMAEILAEFAVNDQMGFASGNFNMDNATRYTLQKRKIKAEDFIDSYKYYTAKGSLEGILEDSQEIILTKNPDSKKYIQTRLENREKAENPANSKPNIQTMEKQ